MLNRLLLDLRFHMSIMVFVFIVFFVGGYLLPSDTRTSLIMFIFVAGMAGGVINTYLRLQKLSIEEQKLRHSNILSIIQIYLSPITAGFLAIIFYLLCLSGFIAGELFPQFVGLERDYSSVADMFEYINPAKQIDALKAVTWGFIAGFFEKFIPNTLDKIIKEMD